MSAQADEQLLPFREATQRRAWPLATVADALGVSQNTVKSWASRGKIRTVQAQPGGKRRVPLDELERFVAEGWPVDVFALLDAD